MRDLIAFLHDALPADHAHAGISANPTGETAPPVWVLGSSEQSALYAAHFGLPISFAHFISPEGGPAVVEAYRKYFKPSALHDKPEANVGISVLCAETEEQAQYLAASRDLWVMRLRTTGNPGPIPSAEEAASFAYSDEQRALMRSLGRRSIVGTPDQVKARLLQQAETYGVDEFVCVTITYDFAARMRSYELLAQAFDLKLQQAA